MSIEDLARAVAAEWQMGFEGIELDFALEVAKRAVSAEREACAKVCESFLDQDIESNTAYEDLVADGAIQQCADAIRNRSNASLRGAEPSLSAERPSRSES